MDECLGINKEDFIKKTVAYNNLGDCNLLQLDAVFFQQVSKLWFNSKSGLVVLQLLARLTQMPKSLCNYELSPMFRRFRHHC